jgi:hypothetical protein
VVTPASYRAPTRWTARLGLLWWAVSTAGCCFAGMPCNPGSGAQCRDGEYRGCTGWVELDHRYEILPVYEAYPCAFCYDDGQGSAACVRAPATECVPGSPPYCDAEGNYVSCDTLDVPSAVSRWEATSCGEGSTCVTGGEGGACVDCRVIGGCPGH